MSDNPKAADALRLLLDGEREDELDCDRFFALLAPYLDGQIGDKEVLGRIAHHAHLCPECNEELEILMNALKPQG